jgi:hypothetical protein
MRVTRGSTTEVGSSLKVSLVYAITSSFFLEGCISGAILTFLCQGTPVIYVNFNYRVGPLGFPQGQEADDKGALNLGLKDQLAALEWVQLHIQAFGGDRTKVLAVLHTLDLDLS